MILILAVSSLLLALTVVLLATVLGRSRRGCELLQAELDRFRGEAAQRDNDLRQRNEMDSVKDEFISTVSHELRTPLTSIRGALGLLSAGLMGKVDDKAANLLRIASTNTDRLVRLINDILDLERMSSGAAPLQPRQCSMRDLVLQAVDTMGAMAQAAQVHLQVVAEAGNPPTLCEADPDRMQQVLTNLFSNAIKFSPAGAVVSVRLETPPGEVLIRVEDRGRGVPAPKLESIFDRFQQVDPSDSRQKGGTGLGLAICRTIVQQHGGRIWAERNDAGGHGVPGTTFLVRLPRVHQETTANPPHKGPHGTMLMGDDDPGVRQTVGEHVRKQGAYSA